MGLLVSYPRLWLGQALSVVGWVKDSCSQGTLPQYNGKGLHLHETVHLSAITSGFAQGHCGE